jgi:hypothetical protein
MLSEKTVKPDLYTTYPLSSLLIYNGVTTLHYLFGGLGIIIGYNFTWIAYLLGLLYLAFAFGQMYIMMPLVVCPNCVYYHLKDSLCISGMNVVAKKVAPAGDIKNFGRRGQGLFCHNNLYMAAKIVPLIIMIPALIWNFSFVLLAIFLAVVGLLAYRIFVLFPKIACVHCRAKNICPNAASMGLSNK